MHVEDNDVLKNLNGVESTLLSLAKPYLQVRDNERHTLNAVEFTLTLLENHGADRSIVVPAMILHDVGWSRVSRDIISRACRPNPDKKLVRIHEIQSMEIAASILGNVGYDPVRSASIIEIIDGHDTREGALSTNDKIVKDSDKLTRYAKNFWFWTGALPMAPGEFANVLEGLIDDWFFLDASKKIALMQLSQRRMEANQGSGMEG